MRAPKIYSDNSLTEAGFFGIPNYFGHYIINKFGDVYSTKFGLKKLKAHINKAGYMQIILCVNNKAKTYTTHRLMALTFLKISPGLQVNHINGIKTDNRLENLEVITPKENIKHSYLLGLRLSGEKHPYSKLTCKDVMEIKDLIKVLSGSEIARIYKVSRSTIYNIKYKNKWKFL